MYAKMAPDTRILKKSLFGWLLQKRPAVKLCWKDKVCQDIKKCGIEETFWFN